MFRYKSIFYRIVLFGLVSYAFLTFTLPAAEPDNTFLQTKWTTENGLPQNTVTSIAQTPDGYLWVGTFGGLARFDGVRFKIYNTSTTSELKTNRIVNLLTARNGTLWIGTERGEIITLKDGEFTLVDDVKSSENAAFDEFYDDPGSGLVWAIALARIRKCTEQICTEGPPSAEPINDIKRDSDGHVWQLKGGKLFKFVDDEFVLDSNAPDGVSGIQPNPNGGLWLCVGNDVLLYKNGRIETILKLGQEIGKFAMQGLADGTLLLNNGMYLFRINDDQIQKFRLENLDPDTVHKIFVDRDGDIWLGRVGEGLVRLLPRQVQTVAFESASNGKKSTRLSVNSIAEDFDGNIWFSTDSSLFRLQNGVLERLESSDRGFGSLLVDGRGTVWNGTATMLQSYENGRFVQHPEISWKETQSSSALFQDSAKNLWYGCYLCGVFLSDGKTILARYTTADGLVGDTPDFIKETRDDAIWIGTTTGLSRLKDEKFTNFTTENGLSNDYVRDLYEDKDGTIWVGTYGGGLNRLRDGKWTAITSANGLFDDIVSRILIDDDDVFWFLGNRGIFSVSRKMLNDFANGKIDQVYCTAFTTADGLSTSEGNGGYQGAAIRARDGKLWFSMIDGVAVIDPTKEKLAPPKPIIEEILVGHRLIDTKEKLELPADAEDLEIHFSAISFRKPEQIRFRYNVSGLDDDWKEIGTRRTEYFSNLRPGSYRFRLSAANADGDWSPTFAEIEISVRPHFYQTWLFYLLMLLLAGGLIYLIFRYRFRQIENARLQEQYFSKRLIDAQEAERERIAAELHDGIGQNLLIIKNRALLGRNPKASKSFAAEQLTEISETSSHALDETRAIAANLRPLHLQRFGLTNALESMVGQIEDSSGIKFETAIEELSELVSDSDELSIFRIVQECLNNIVKHSEAKTAGITIGESDGLLKIVVYDNGNGFEIGAVDPETSRDRGFGLTSIEQRVKMLGGSFQIESKIGSGTKIILSIRNRRNRV